MESEKSMKKNEKKTKATVKTATHKTSKNAPTSVPSIQALNDAYEDIVNAQSMFTVACEQNEESEVLRRLNGRVMDALEKFDEIRKQMTTVKFDAITGEYFLPNRDENGCETYRVAVTKTSKTIVEVRALTREDALVAAEDEYKSDNPSAVIERVTPTVTVEIVSIPA